MLRNGVAAILAALAHMPHWQKSLIGQAIVLMSVISSDVCTTILSSPCHVPDWCVACSKAHLSHRNSTNRYSATLHVHDFGQVLRCEGV